MTRFLKQLIIFTCFLLISSSSAFAISKVAARYNVMEFSVSSVQPHGSYNKIGIGNLGTYGWKFDDGFGRSYNIDADDLYKNSFSVGVNYGRLINDNMVFNVGFSFTEVKHKEVFQDAVYIYTFQNFHKLRIYSLDFNWNYYVISPVKQSIAPYAGVGVQTGLLASSVEGYSSESDFVMATAFNFGADLTIWRAQNKMSSLAVSSINSYQFYASDSRPKYMTIGFGLRFFMRP